MSILVTGATGFVMANLARHLVEQGHTVVAADRQPPDRAWQEFVGGPAGEVEFRQLDVSDLEAVRGLVRDVRPARVVHGAAITAIPLEAERFRFLETARVNVMGTLHVLDAFRETGTGRIVVVSSGGVYGGREEPVPIAEDDPKRPAGLYPLSKWAADALASRYAEVHDLDLAVVRLTSPFGPLERDTGSRPRLSPIEAWVATALRGDPVRVGGTPSQVRDVVYVADVATAIAAVLLAEALPHRAYNVGWGRGTTAGEILAVLGQLVPGLRVELHPDEPSPFASVATPPRGPLDAGRLRRDLGWTPRYDLESGLRAYIDWLRRGPGVR